MLLPRIGTVSQPWYVGAGWVNCRHFQYSSRYIHDRRKIVRSVLLLQAREASYAGYAHAAFDSVRLTQSRRSSRCLGPSWAVSNKEVLGADVRDVVVVAFP